jgi:hypothetical protein
VGDAAWEDIEGAGVEGVGVPVRCSCHFLFSVVTHKVCRDLLVRANKILYNENKYKEQSYDEINGAPLRSY